ncbi:hypothetical protein LMG26691_04165 [Achromobacter animicus]|nr:hypothetical protein LMG26691_04165 [Achromobacter animicus]
MPASVTPVGRPAPAIAAGERSMVCVAMLASVAGFASALSANAPDDPARDGAALPASAAWFARPMSVNAPDVPATVPVARFALVMLCATLAPTDGSTAASGSSAAEPAPWTSSAGLANCAPAFMAAADGFTLAPPAVRPATVPAPAVLAASPAPAPAGRVLAATPAAAPVAETAEALTAAVALPAAAPELEAVAGVVADCVGVALADAVGAAEGASAAADVTFGADAADSGADGEVADDADAVVCADADGVAGAEPDADAEAGADASAEFCVEFGADAGDAAASAVVVELLAAGDAAAGCDTCAAVALPCAPCVPAAVAPPAGAADAELAAPAPAPAPNPPATPAPAPPAPLPIPANPAALLIIFDAPSGATEASMSVAAGRADMGFLTSSAALETAPAAEAAPSIRPPAPGATLPSNPLAAGSADMGLATMACACDTIPMVFFAVVSRPPTAGLALPSSPGAADSALIGFFAMPASALAWPASCDSLPAAPAAVLPRSLKPLGTMSPNPPRPPPAPAAPAAPPKPAIRLVPAFLAAVANTPSLCTSSALTMSGSSTVVLGRAGRLAASLPGPTKLCVAPLTENRPGPLNTMSAPSSVTLPPAACNVTRWLPRISIPSADEVTVMSCPASASRMSVWACRETGACAEMARSGPCCANTLADLAETAAYVCVAATWASDCAVACRCSPACSTALAGVARFSEFGASTSRCGPSMRSMSASAMRWPLIALPAAWPLTWRA